jgi:hypothetical protein
MASLTASAQDQARLEMHNRVLEGVSRKTCSHGRDGMDEELVQQE